MRRGRLAQPLQPRGAEKGVILLLNNLFAIKCKPERAHMRCEVVPLRWIVWGTKWKNLLMSVIGRLLVDAGVRVPVIVVVKIINDAALRIGWAGKNGPFADFEHLGFEARPAAPKTLHRFSAWALS